MSARILVVVGPTASGKTDLVVDAIARSGVEAEAIVLDSRQLYRGLDVGTGKPDADQLRRVRHHLLDCIEPTATPDAMDYRRRAESAAEDILSRGAVPVFVGGAGFYLRALREGFHEIEQDAAQLATVRAEHAALRDEELVERLRELDPESAARLHPNDRYRIARALELCRLSGRAASDLERAFRPRPILDATFETVRLMPPAPLLHERIGARTTHWLDHGWGDEVQALIDAGVPRGAPGLQTLGYRQVLDLVEGRADRATTENAIVVATRRYARAQRTWFRKEPATLTLEVVDAGSVDAVAGLVRDVGGSP